MTQNLCLGLEIDTIMGLNTIQNTIILWLQILRQMRTVFEINLPLTYLLELCLLLSKLKAVVGLTSEV